MVAYNHRHYKRVRLWLIVAVCSFAVLGLIQGPLENVCSDNVAEVLQRIRQSMPAISVKERAAQLRFTRTSRTSWYGIEAYPSVKDKETSWEWLMAFFESIDKSPDKSSDIECAAKNRGSVFKAVQFVTKRATDKNAAHIRFPNTATSTLETELLAILPGISNRVDSVASRRYDCINKLCNPVVINETIHLKSPWNLHNAQLVMVDFLFADVFEIERLIEKLDSVETLVTVVTTEHFNQTKDADYAIMLYDFFHKLYFELDFVPVLEHSCHCKEVRYGCQMWIVWQPWSFKDDKGYIPPAGNGSYEHEMLRLASFVGRPNPQVCDRLQAFGGQWTEYDFVDGAWTLCLDQLTLRNHERCVVYSFGIKTDWSFDDSMHSLGCSVYSFDPSINLPSHQRNTHHWFHAWGLGTTIGVTSNKDPTWKLYPLAGIKRRLNHGSVGITVLKMDIEGSEWDFFKSKNLEADLEGVNQLLFEIHPPPVFPIMEAYMMHRLVKMGFALMWSHQNPISVNTRSASLNISQNQLLYELSFIRKTRPFFHWNER